MGFYVCRWNLQYLLGLDLDIRKINSYKVKDIVMSSYYLLVTFRKTVIGAHFTYKKIMCSVDFILSVY